ncbi:MAG: DNA repair protein RadC [Clostridia bacterium]|nr:DNA repair protein RadC [Clostridia bacterium]
MASIHDGHRSRMRKRLKDGGLQGFQEHEILEWMLFHTIPRGDVNPLAHALIRNFGNLAGVLEADVDDLLSVEGVGESTALFLSTYLDVYQRYMLSKENKNVRMTNMDAIEQHVRLCIRENAKEYLFAVLLDPQFRKLCCSPIAKGGPTSVDVNVRELVALCLRRNATYLVLAHNHPSGILLPSYSDVQTTMSLRDALSPIGVRLLDHLVIGQDDYVSMASSKEYSYIFD